MKVALGFLLATGVAQAQLVEPPPSPRNLNDIVQRLAISDASVIGTVVKQDLAFGGSARGGMLFTIRVERELCNRLDFLPGGSGKADLPGEVHVFMPDDVGPRLDDPRPVEQFLTQGKHLLILKKDSQAENLIRQYGLDPKLDYYRAVGGERGAIALEVASYEPPEYFELGILNNPIPGFTLPKERNPVSKWPLPNFDVETRKLVAEATSICDAMRSDREKALERLHTPNAGIALKILRGEPLK